MWTNNICSHVTPVVHVMYENVHLEESFLPVTLGNLLGAVKM